MNILRSVIASRDRALRVLGLYVTLIAVILASSPGLVAADKVVADPKLSDFKLGDQVIGKAYNLEKVSGRAVVICTSFVSGNDTSPAYSFLYSLFLEYGKQVDFVMVDTSSKYTSTETIARIMKRAGEGYPVYKGFKKSPFTDTKDSVGLMIFDSSGKMIFRGGFTNTKLTESIRQAASLTVNSVDLTNTSHDLSEFEWGKPIAGPEISAEDLKGRPAVILLWNSQPNYRPETWLLNFVNAHDAHGDGLTFIAVEMNANRSPPSQLPAIAEMTKKAGVTFSVPAGILRYPREIAYRAVPMCFVINAEGRVIYSGSFLTTQFREAMLTAAVKGSALGKPKPAEKQEATPKSPVQPKSDEKKAKEPKFA